MRPVPSVFDPSLHLSEVSEIVQTIYFLEVLQHFKDDTVDFPTVFQNIEIQIHTILVVYTVLSVGIVVYFLSTRQQWAPGVAQRILCHHLCRRFFHKNVWPVWICYHLQGILQIERIIYCQNILFTCCGSQGNNRDTQERGTQHCQSRIVCAEIISSKTNRDKNILLCSGLN